MIKSKVYYIFFPGATSKDLVHYIKPASQENEFDTSILHMGVVNHVLNNSVKVLCQKHRYTFTDNGKVSSENLWQDGLHLKNSGQGVLQNKYVVTLNGSYLLGPSFTQLILTASLKPNVIQFSLQLTDNLKGGHL